MRLTRTFAAHALPLALALLAFAGAPLGAQGDSLSSTSTVRGAAAAPDSTAGARAADAALTHSLTGEQPANAPTAAGEHGAGKSPDIIMPHITDSHEVELPWFNRELGYAWHLPRFAPVHVGRFAIDLSPTKHVVMLLLAALLCAATLITAAVAHTRHHHDVGRPRGFAAGIEAVVLYIRDEVILANVGHHGQAFVPYLLTTFFFILFANMLGLVPYGSTATGNISVTATLALLALLVIEIGGMRALGWGGYIKTILYWPSDMKFGGMKIFLAILLTPVEFLGKLTKPFALAIRLFANMTAGHVIVLAFIGMIFTFNRWYVTPAPLVMSLAIMLLEVLVALIQAYIFTLLVSVFIGQIREAHH